MNRTLTALLGCLLLAAPAAQAQFLYTTNNGTITITGYNGPGGAVIIPASINGFPVTVIGETAFRDRVSLTSVTIPGSVTGIGTSAFFGCSGLTSVTIPGSVTSIGTSAFYGCSGLINVTIGNGVTIIPDYMFYDCYALTSVTLPGSLISIGDYAFSYCGELTSIAIPGGITNIGYWALYDCNGLTQITVDPNNLFYSSADGVLFDKSQTTLIRYPPRIGGSYSIPNSVTIIGSGAFHGCSGLTNITIPGSVTSIGLAAFNECHRLTSVTIPESVRSIGDEAFDTCYGLTNVVIAYGVTNIGRDAFNTCYGLTSMTIPGSVSGMGGGAFFNCYALTSVTLSGSLISVGEMAFGYCTNLTSISIPGSVSSIGGDAFFCCYGLASVTLLEGVSSIGDGMFNSCTSLTNIVIPGSVTNIGQLPFRFCSSLTTIAVNTQNPYFTSVDGVLFDKSQTTLIQYPTGRSGNYTVPGSVTNIGWAFYDHASLTNVYFMGDAPSWFSIPQMFCCPFGDGVTVYYLPGTIGWDSYFAGAPAVLWNPQIRTSDASFGLHGNQFGFNITGTADIPVLIGASTNLASPVWFPLQAITVTNGLVYFSEPVQTNGPARFYRLRWP